MVEVTWTPQALDDLDSIAEFISEDSPCYAGLFVINVFDVVNRLYEFPESGRVVPETNTPQIREIIMGNYRIVYRINLKKIEILTVIHGAKLLDSRILN